VAHYEQILNQHGIEVAWSRRHKCFMLYVEDRPGHYTPQLGLLRASSGPEPLNEALVSRILRARAEAFRMTGETIMSRIAQAERDERSRRAEEKYRDAAYISKHIHEAVQIDTGRRKSFLMTPNRKLMTPSRKLVLNG
jgi:hypothetical protein